MSSWYQSIVNTVKRVWRLCASWLGLSKSNDVSSIRAQTPTVNTPRVSTETKPAFIPKQSKGNYMPEAIFSMDELMSTEPDDDSLKTASFTSTPEWFGSHQNTPKSIAASGQGFVAPKFSSLFWAPVPANEEHPPLSINMIWPKDFNPVPADSGLSSECSSVTDFNPPSVVSEHLSGLRTVIGFNPVSADIDYSSGCPSV